MITSSPLFTPSLKLFVDARFSLHCSWRSYPCFTSRDCEILRSRDPVCNIHPPPTHTHTHLLLHRIRFPVISCHSLLFSSLLLLYTLINLLFFRVIFCWFPSKQNSSSISNLLIRYIARLFRGICTPSAFKFMFPLHLYRKKYTTNCGYTPPHVSHVTIPQTKRDKISNYICCW